MLNSVVLDCPGLVCLSEIQQAEDAMTQVPDPEILESNKYVTMTRSTAAICNIKSCYDNGSGVHM